MKGANLSSPSVAHRHLQKLEELGLLSKNEYGEYFIKKRIRVRGYIWVGRRLVSKMMLYSMLFIGILAAEIAILAIHYEVEHYEFKVFLGLLIGITAVAVGIFLVEAWVQRRKPVK